MASAIMTTDTKPKVAYEEIIIGDELIKISASRKRIWNDFSEFSYYAFIHIH